MDDGRFVYLNNGKDPKVLSQTIQQRIRIVLRLHHFRQATLYHGFDRYASGKHWSRIRQSYPAVGQIPTEIRMQRLVEIDGCPDARQLFFVKHSVPCPVPDQRLSPRVNKYHFRYNRIREFPNHNQTRTGIGGHPALLSVSKNRLNVHHIEIKKLPTHRSNSFLIHNHVGSLYHAARHKSE